MKFWTMPLKPGNQLTMAKEEEDPIDSNGEPLEASQPACSIRVTSEDGALCIINPLFISVHSDVSWLDLAPGPCRLSSRRAALQVFNGSTEAAPSKQEVRRCQNHPKSLEEEEEEVVGKGDLLASSASARRKLLLRSLACNTSEDVSEDLPSSPGLHQKEIKSPHRVSWIEGIPAEIPPAWSLKKSSSESSLLSESLLLPPIPELDSLSVSSVEDEPEGLPLTPAASHKRQGRSSAVLTYKVLHRLSAVGSALGSFLCAERRVSKRVQELAQEPTSYIGGLVQSFVGHILRGGGMRHPTSTDMLQEIRQMISNLKGYLCESSELRTICEHGEAEEMDLGSVVEGALYKSILKPLRDSIYTQLLDFRSRDGTVDKLRKHQVTMSKQSLAELGVISNVPDAAGLERIQTKLDLLHQAYSPRKKETQMLKICKMLYESMNQTAGRTEPFGADDFLPVLIYMLVNCDIVSVQLDVEYMMELMDPSQLQGEGGYYLTTWFGALFHIANFQPAAMITRQISIEAQYSIHQWHRRRTIHPHHHHPIRRHSQNILYISFHEPFNNQKTISVTTDMTTASVCAVCAEKYGISDREAYGLFLVSGESSQLLAEDSYPQRLHSAILRSKRPPGSFVYKPKDGALPAIDSLLLQEPKSLTEALESGSMEQSVAD
ncbi:ras and Rab interactor-like protein isoform X2 [Sceloporus undulatus]|nr:ras and Rab interactor-like protein isoform X2 [Sceloporus undulatus]